MQFTVSDLYFSYYKSPLTVQGAKFSFAKNQRVLALAKKGEGKTTLLKVLSGFEDSYLGSILFEGKQLRSLSDEEKNFSLLFSRAVLFEKRSVKENFDYLSDCIKRERFTETQMLEALGSFDCTAPLAAKVKGLSPLDKFKVSLARSFLKKPSVIFVDDIFEIAEGEEHVEELKRIYGNIFEKFSTSTLVFALSDEHFKILFNDLQRTQIDKVLYLNLAHLFEFNSIEQFCGSCADLDFFDFVSGYGCAKVQVALLDKKYFLEIEQKREVEFESKFNAALSGLKLDSGGLEDCSLIFEGKFDYENLTDKQINAAFAAGKVKLYSNLDRKRVI